jgi:deazaflavin-dependent oxidoreductase (nitroreductase family)
MNTMLLTTKRRSTGKERTTPVYYVRDGKNLVAACENFGLKTASSWPKNLLADPQARIEIDGAAANYRARPAADDEVTRNMPRLIEMWPAHDTYLKRSGKRYVFVFEPVGTAAGTSTGRGCATPTG